MTNSFISSVSEDVESSLYVLLNCHLTQLVTYTSKSIGDRYSHLAKSSKHQAHFLRLFEKNSSHPYFQNSSRDEDNLVSSKFPYRFY